MPKAVITIEVKQHRAMWKLVNEQVGTEEFRTWIFDLTNGKSESSSDLNFDQKNYVIEKLGGTPFRRNRKNYGSNVIDIDTAKQGKLLNDWWFKYSHRTKEGLEKLCEKTIKKNTPITVKDYQQMIEAVKAMNKREEQNPTFINAETKEAA
jgi:hypothetical protein